MSNLMMVLTAIQVGFILFVYKLALERCLMPKKERIKVKK